MAKPYQWPFSKINPERMAISAIVFLLAEILFVTAVASQPLETDLVQIIKHLQTEGIEFKRRLGILEDTIQLQNVHIKKQDRRIQVLENIIESQTDEISSHGPVRQYTSNSDVDMNNVSKEHWTAEAVKGIDSNQKHTKLRPINRIGQRHITDENAGFGDRGPADSDAAKENTGNTQHISRSMTAIFQTVAFQAFLSKDLFHIANHQPIVFDGIISNIGGGYHTHHGLFTAPKSGIYIFSSSLLVQTNYYIEANIMKNGQLVQGIIANAREHNGFDQGTGTVVMQLSIGDEVWVETTDWSTDTALRSGGYYTSFMGCLIMEQ